MFLMSALFFEKGGILFKGGHYIREDIILGNTVGDESTRAHAQEVQITYAILEK